MPRVLLAEDDRDFRDVLCSVLEADGRTVVAVPNGRAALDALARAHDDFDVVLLDVHTPSMTGLDVLRESRIAGMTVPVVLMTSFADHALTKRALALGAACVVEKPFDDERLRQVIDGILQGR